MKHLKVFEKFIENDKEPLVYFSFDIDDNLLFMPTEIKMKHLIDGEWVDEYVSTEKFAKIRTLPDWKFSEESFEGFRDWGPKGNNTFLSDFKNAIIGKKFGPSWTKFIECLVNGNIFSIITSRGHEPSNVRKAFYWLIYEYGLNNFKNLDIKNVDKSSSLEDQMIENLLKYHELFGSNPEQVIDSYIDLCPIYTVTSKYCINKFGNISVEEAKKLSLRDFNRMVKRFAKKLGVIAKYGFSDDDPRFVKAAEDEFMNLKDKNKNIEYSIFDTGGNKNIRKKI
jgi:hypothetical protein